jgi:hypothetical protein
MNWLDRFLCSIGFHKWFYPLVRMGGSTRECKRCGKWQQLEFYSNRTQEWKDITIRENGYDIRLKENKDG